MRVLMVMLLLSLAVSAMADGMVLNPEAIERLRETDQLAVIDLDHDGATVDMFIAIDGIPAGKTITYVLPFWHRPVGFTLEEMDGKRFSEQRLRRVVQRIDWENTRLSHPCGSMVKPALSLAGMTFLGPLSPAATQWLEPNFFFGKASESAAVTPTSLTPYQSASTPQARAELYRVEEKDLQALVSRAGLPEKYATVLRRYRTNYYAIMHLTGVAHRKQSVENGVPNSYGVHYHFRHPMPHTGAYTYTYPLGTGGSWRSPSC